MLPPLTPVLAWDAAPHLRRPDSISSANQALKSSALTPSKASKYGGLTPLPPKLPQISGNPPYLSSVRCPHLHLFNCPSRPAVLRYPSVFFLFSFEIFLFLLEMAGIFLNLPDTVSKSYHLNPTVDQKNLAIKIFPMISTKMTGLMNTAVKQNSPFFSPKKLAEKLQQR